MFDTLTDRFDGIFDKLRGKGKLSEKDVDEALREIRLALLEADVNFEVVKSLVGRIRERAVGDELSKALNPGQQIVKIVLEELTESLGGEAMQITFAAKPPTAPPRRGCRRKPPVKTRRPSTNRMGEKSFNQRPCRSLYETQGERHFKNS